MRRIFISRKFLIGLCAYLRRLEMSIDRTYQCDIEPLRSYCERDSGPNLRQVLDRFKTIGIVLEQPPENQVPTEHKGILAAGGGSFQWYFRKGIILCEDEVRFICHILFKFSQELDQGETVNPAAFSSIRLQLRKVVDGLQRLIPSREINDRIYRVEHLNQNPTSKTETLASINNHEDWLVSELTILN